MRRRSRQTSWIHRWSRPIIAVIAVCGALLTAYLTLTHFTGQQVALCTAENAGCDFVLSSPYARLFGLPLTIFGCLGYLSLAVLAAGPLLVNAEQHKELRQKLEDLTWLLLLALSTATLIFSGYLMSLLFLVLKTPCLYCITSATFMTSIFVLTLLGRVWEDGGQVFFTSVLVGVVALIGTLGFHAQASQVASVSGNYQYQLAEHLEQVGAKMYGAYWCPHCNDQKELFGPAFNQVRTQVYVECDPKGENAQAQLCQQQKITGYPTWEIQGKRVEGTQSLDKLAELSGYTGPREKSVATPSP